MVGCWLVFFRHSEMMAWWRVLDAGLSAEDRHHRALALVLGSWATWMAQDWDTFNVYSTQASALADPLTWVDAEAHFLQAVACSRFDPLRSDRLLERSFEIDARIGLSPDPMRHQSYFLGRLRRADGRDEALAVLDEWLADVGDSTPTLFMPAVFALYGDTRTALELKPRAELASGPMGQFGAELSQAVLASAQGQFEEAEQHLATMTSIWREFVPRGEAACVIGFAKVALDRGDYARASRLLATVNSSVGPGERPFRSIMDALVHARSTAILREVLDLETARITQAEGAALSLKEALDAELIRSATTAMVDSAD
jgi:hypothetical protein